jgi:hypothetical protein
VTGSPNACLRSVSGFGLHPSEASTDGPRKILIISGPCVLTGPVVIDGPVHFGSADLEQGGGRNVLEHSLHGRLVDGMS